MKEGAERNATLGDESSLPQLNTTKLRKQGAGIIVPQLIFDNHFFVEGAPAID